MKSPKSVNLRLPTSISPVVKWVLTIVVLGLGVVLVAVLYAQEQARNSTLKDDVNKSSGVLVQNSLKKNDLQKRLIVANMGLTELSAQFPSPEQTMDVEEALFHAAADAGVEVVSISCPEPENEQIAGASYKAFGPNVSVVGDNREELLKFVGRLGFWLPSADIVSVSMNEYDMTLIMRVYTSGS